MHLKVIQKSWLIKPSVWFISIIFIFCFSTISSFLYSAPLHESLTHTVRPGETLWEIANTYNVSIENILSLNKLNDGNKLKVNQVLVIPRTGSYKKQGRHFTKPVLRKENGIYHRLQKGQTLWELSKIYQVPVSAIIETNEINSPASVRAGQLIFIPLSETMMAERKNTDKLLQYVRDLVALSPHTHRRHWKFIIVHHSATNLGNAASFHYYHKYKRHMVNGLAYHFVITNGNKGPDGAIEVGPRWKRQINGGHVKSDYYNDVGIGICLVGNFQEYAPTPKQFNSLIALIKVLQEMCDLPGKYVIGHREIKGEQTLCPGKLFPLTRMKNIINR